MVQINVSRDDFDKINALFPEIFPDVVFSLKVQDDALVKLGFCDSAPCVVEFDITAREFYDILEELIDLEINAYNTSNGREPAKENPAYQKYLKYGCLYEILYIAEKVFSPIGRVKYVGKSFGVESLTNGKIYDVIDVDCPFLRVVDDSGEDYLYSITMPSSMEDLELCGKWEIVDDPEGILKENMKIS